MFKKPRDFAPVYKSLGGKIDKKYQWVLNWRRWYTSKNGRRMYFSTRDGRFPIQLHRAIMWIHMDLRPNKKIDVDHINGDSLDNRACNLRVATRAQNNINRTIPPRNNTSGHCGVTFDSTRKKWVAQIVHKGKNIRLGRFNSKEFAVIARKNAQIGYFGEFAPKR